MPSFDGDAKSLRSVLIDTHSFTVPQYQRNYSWDEEFTDFWGDIFKFFELRHSGKTNEDYFLGSIVLIEKEDRHYEILDGQQRLASCTILLSVFIEKLLELKPGTANRLYNLYIGEQDTVTDTVERYKITMNAYDRDYFRAHVQELDADNIPKPKGRYPSHKLILNAKNNLKKYLEDELVKIDEDKRGEWISSFIKCFVENVFLIKVWSTEEDAAASIFEVLNDRGVQLSTADLIRNFLFIKAPSDQERDAMAESWKDILALEKKVEDFFRHFWVSKYGDEQRKLYRAVKAEFVTQNMQSMQFCQELVASAGVYQSILAADSDDEETAHYLWSLNEMGSNYLFPAILSAVESFNKLDAKKFLRNLITYNIRHKIIGGGDNGRIESTLFDMAKKIRTGQSCDECIKVMKEKTLTDEEFVSAFEKAEVTRAKWSRYILVEIENSIGTGEKVTRGTKSVNLEHILPQTMYGGCSIDPDVYRTLINQLGNLTLIMGKWNSSMKNKPPEVKFNEYYVGSDITLTKSIPKPGITWGKEAIDRRQEMLGQHAVSIWKFD